MRFIAYLPLLVVSPDANLTLNTICSRLVPIDPQVRVGFILDSQVGWWIQLDWRRHRPFSDREYTM